MRPLIDHLRSKFETLYEPLKNVAVDEAMIKFQEQSSLKQYVPQKLIKSGIKVWILGDAPMATSVNLTSTLEDREVGLGAHVLMKLT